MIQDGTFNKEWISEYQKNGKDSFDKYMKQYDEHQNWKKLVKKCVKWCGLILQN